MEKNITLLTDSYKIGHFNMYPDGTEVVYSYFESRNEAKYNKTVFFGLQYLLKEYLEGKVVTQEDVNFANFVIDEHLGPGAFNRDGWEYILNKHDGKLPVRIKAVPEGTPIPTNNVLMTIENTDPECFWLTNYLETLLTHVWSSSTVATLSREVKILCNHYLDETADTKDGLDFMLHDFGFRGISSIESAGICGAGHLINFQGTDTIAGIITAMKYYKSGVCAYSVPATEHSIMTSYGPYNETELLEELLTKYPAGIISIVIDSYDYENFITNSASQLRHQILTRDGKMVFRPDSGEPISTTLRVFELLNNVFGSTTNSKGFKVLNPKVGVLWGDGIDYDGIRKILHALRSAGWSAENIVFGMGGGLLQKVDRDIQRFAFKCSAQKRNGEWFNIYKKPQDISKMSKKGKQYLYKNGDDYCTSNIRDLAKENVLKTVFENGEIVRSWIFDDVRKNAIL